MTQSPHPFRYFADPVCIAALALYALNRHILKPHHIGGWFTHGYFNDVLCLPLFVPMILYAQRLLGLRRHDGYPRAWEITQQWAVFSVMFQAIIPRFPKTFVSAGDPWDMLAYAVGGVLAGWYWSVREARLESANQERQKKIGDSFDDLRRSTAIHTITRIKREGFPTDEEISRFSDETQHKVRTLLEVSKQE